MSSFEFIARICGLFSNLGEYLVSWFRVKSGCGKFLRWEYFQLLHYCLVLGWTLRLLRFDRNSIARIIYFFIGMFLKSCFVTKGEERRIMWFLFLFDLLLNNFLRLQDLSCRLNHPFLFDWMFYLRWCFDIGFAAHLGQNTIREMSRRMSWRNWASRINSLVWLCGVKWFLLRIDHWSTILINLSKIIVEWIVRFWTLDIRLKVSHGVFIRIYR